MEFPMEEPKFEKKNQNVKFHIWDWKSSKHILISSQQNSCFTNLKTWKPCIMYDIVCGQETLNRSGYK